MGWRILQLEDVSDFVGGSQPPKSEFSNELKEGYVRLLQIRDFKRDDKAVFIKENSTQKFCLEKDIMIGRYGASVGQILRGKSGAYNVALIKTIPDEAIIDNEFFYYFLTSASFQEPLKKVAKRSAQAGFSKSDISSFEIPVPSLAEQKLIVAILDQAFANIDQARQLAERNLKNVRELFDSTLNQIFSKSGKGWSTKTLSSACVIKPPKSEARKQFEANASVSFVPMDCLGINRKALKLGQERKLSEVAGSYTYFAENDVLLAKITPCFENGKLGIARGLKNKVGFGSSEFIVFRCSNEILPDFLYYFLDRQSFRDQGKTLMTGAVGHKRVAKDFIENYQISYPDTEQQRNIVAMLDDLRNDVRELKKIYQQKIAALDELKQSLLQKAFRGELTQGRAAA